MVINVASASATSLVAALRRWRVARRAAVEVLALAEAAAEEVSRLPTEVTALLTGHARSSEPPPRASKANLRGVLTSRGRLGAGEKRQGCFHADLSEVNMKEDQAHIATVLPVS